MQGGRIISPCIFNYYRDRSDNMFKKLKERFKKKETPKNKSDFSDDFNDVGNDEAVNNTPEEQLYQNDVPSTDEGDEALIQEIAGGNEPASGTEKEKDQVSSNDSEKEESIKETEENRKPVKHDVKNQQERTEFSNEDDVNPFAHTETDDNENVGDDSVYSVLETKEKEQLAEETIKEKEFQFVTLSDYTNVDHLKEMVNRKKNQLTEGELLKRLNISPGKEDDDPLEAKKIDYAKQRINSSEVQARIQSYLDRMDKLIENVHLNLTEFHGNTISDDYNLKALDQIEGELNEIDSEKNMKIEEYKKDRDEEYANREERLKQQHEAKVEALKSELETKFHEFQQENNDKKQKEVELYSDEQNKKAELMKNKTLYDEKYRQEKLANNSMITKKQEVLDKSHESYHTVSEEEQKLLYELLSSIMTEIEDKTPDWSVEVTEDAKRALDEKRYEDEKQRQDRLLEVEVEEKRMKLQEKKDELDHKNQQLEREYELKEKELEYKIQEFKNNLAVKERESNEFKEILLEMVKHSKGKPLAFEPSAETSDEVIAEEGIGDQSVNYVGGDDIKKDGEQSISFLNMGVGFLIGVGITVVSIGGYLYFNNNLATDTPNEPIQSNSPEVLSEMEDRPISSLSIVESLENIEDQLNRLNEHNESNNSDSSEDTTDEGATLENDESETERESISLSDDPEGYINAHDFDQVLSELGNNPDQDLVNTVSDIYRHHGAVPEVLTLAERYDYQYDDFDKAILRDDIDVVHYLLLSDEYLNFEENGDYRLNDTFSMLYDHSYFTFSDELVERLGGN